MPIVTLHFKRSIWDWLLARKRPNVFVAKDCTYYRSAHGLHIQFYGENQEYIYPWHTLARVKIH